MPRRGPRKVDFVIFRSPSMTGIRDWMDDAGPEHDSECFRTERESRDGRPPSINDLIRFSVTLGEAV
jgi:hypothetical protein